MTLGAGGADDGAPGEGDEVDGDIEFISGTDFDDTLIGGPDAEQLFGDDGKDEIRGGGADDFLSGGDGADKLEGEARRRPAPGRPARRRRLRWRRDRPVWYSDHVSPSP